MPTGTWSSAGVAAGAGAAGMTIVNWFLVHLNVYLTAWGWGMDANVMAAFAGLIALGGYDLIRQRMSKPSNTTATPSK